MKEMLFLLFVIGGIVLLIFVMSKAKPADSRGHGKKSSAPTRRPQLVDGSPIPGNNVLSDNQRVWNERRKHLQNPARIRGPKAYYARFEDEPEYDGYSRRDRRHLTPAHIKDEVEPDNLAKPSLKSDLSRGRKPVQRDSA